MLLNSRVIPCSSFISMIKRIWQKETRTIIVRSTFPWTETILYFLLADIFGPWLSDYKVADMGRSRLRLQLRLHEAGFFRVKASASAS